MAESIIIPTSGFVLYDPGDDDEVIIPVDGFVFSEAAAGGITNTNLVGSPGRLAGIGGGLAG